MITQLSSSAVICRRSDGVFRMMDIRMPGVDGLRATELLAGPGVPEPLHAVMVTTFGLDENVHAALRAGACGFLLKDAGPNLLVEAVHAAANGEAMVSSAITARLLEHFARRGPGRAGTPENPLTPRESDVVQAVARGQTNEEICRSLVVSMPTVKTHIGAVIAIWAWESGLVR
ncbi:LuxR C-terminal-related transcriptional regulator [Amycolatopsis sp. FBCC-B4732]|uniref:LuxR C-terminal-related transcriptional regulator n=1 Tax=Amycolatopsis sp. FBCC-B4732 TaxID=3079339 RepID=UPI0037C10E93